ncbi:hydroxyacylglutathione hydrolase, cell morphogenesis protein Las1 [Histoplasma capsulatum G186AR]|uniref:Hydroxyacylglutathione hydrolase, cell morphogenesis protein Las1 n=1 Tax=Ajellomyces capsulatus TaxID=5037 RepID=A0A8H7YEV1_AJECA|nr:hydroxyacylglutathione hydrolase, cell morphogenesis protein Las1 [Histoplasma capsulatum]QSS73013.1 hydroxyacylglutathione hydrolase, cell morphogenesis protein Las1 [Histoplasma capsulatum G186AR]
MPRLQFTPWKELSELLSIRSKFYPSMTTDGEPADMRARACSTVWVWKLRGNLPHAVEATALLTDAILHDDDARKHSIFSIRATYSAAFCRFVTGLVDSKLYGRKQTMFQRAMELGLPASFVELRHEATHRELPALTVLRNAAHRSLEWLWEFYWAGLGDIEVADAGMDVQEPNGVFPFTKNEIQRTLKNAVLGENSLSESYATRGSRKSESFPGLKNVALICRYRQGELTVSKTLLEHGILVPVGRTLGSSMESAFSTWDTFLKELCQQQPTFLTTLSDELVRVLADKDNTAMEEDPYSEAIYLWLDHLLNSSTWATPRRLYLSTCHLDAACHNATGYWARHLRSLINRYSHKLDINTSKIGNGYGASEFDTDVRAVALGLEDPADVDADLDSNLLRNYGWDVNGNWKYKPIGVV